MAIVIVLMLSGGETLEDYAGLRAQKSVKKLINRLPSKVLVKTINVMGLKEDLYL